MNKLVVIIFFVFGITVIGNAQETVLYVNNSIDNTNAIVIRIFTPDFKNKDGFYIYRKSDNSAWQKLNDKAIVQKESKDIGDKMNAENKQLLDLLNSDENTGEGLIVLVLATYIIQNKDLADAVGIRFIDNDLTDGVSYTYKIKNAKTGKKIATSKPFTKGVYSPMSPPKSLKAYQNGNKIIEFEWEAKPLQYYGINIYRAVNSQKTEKLNEKPIFLTKIEDRNGQKTWPKIKFTDEDLKLGNEYTYQIEALDYFGNPGQLSEPMIVDFEDVEPPSPTKGLFTRINNKNMVISVSWRKNPAKDLKGYRLYYAGDKDSNKMELSKRIISADSTTFRYNATEAGDYTIWVAAVDSAENISFSKPHTFTVADKTPPQIPNNCSFELLGKGNIKISWQSEITGDFMTYRVFRKESTAHNFALMNSDDFDSTVFMDRIDLSVKNAFQYYIIAMDTLYNKSDRSEIITVKLPDVTAPGIPFLKNVEIIEGKININWRENKDNDIAGYNVYFFNSSDTNKINKELIKTTAFIDQKSHADNNLQYRITAVDSTGNESAFSNPFLLNKAYKSMADGSFSKLKIKTKKGSKEINILWKYKEGNTPKGFVVYRAGSDDKFKPICGLQSENNVKDKVSSTGVYKYKVVAFYSSGDKSTSRIKEVTVN